MLGVSVPEYLLFALFLIFPAAMVFAGSMDLFTMTIPNRISIGMVAGFLVAAPFSSLTLTAFLWHLAAGFSMLVVGILMFSRGWLGGGDAKLLAAATLWLGFDRLFGMLDTLANPDTSAQTYPPYNIERTGENDYRISMAVAGFGENDLAIEAKENTLTVKGEKKDEAAGRDVLYRGIASRAFERRFQLADYVVVKGASLENGLLHIDLVREIPEAMKPRQIPIAGAAKAKQIEAHAA